jgi:hypothetical protein
MEVSIQPHILATLHLGKEPLVFTEQEPGGLWSQSGHGGEEKNSYRCQKSDIGHPACSQSLYRLS